MQVLDRQQHRMLAGVADQQRLEHAQQRRSLLLRVGSDIRARLPLPPPGSRSTSSGTASSGSSPAATTAAVSFSGCTSAASPRSSLHLISSSRITGYSAVLW